MPGKLDWLYERYDLRPRDHGRVVRQMFRERGDYHAKSRINRHFNRNQWTTPGGPYGYSKRSKQTVERKRRMGIDPHRPNYKTGTMYSQVKANSTVTATQNKWTWRSRGSQSRPLPDWQRRELEALAPDEKFEDIQFFMARYSELSVRPEYKRIRKRRITG